MRARILSAPATLVREMARNPVARFILAGLLFLASLGGLGLTAFADQYINGGVAWGTSIPLVENTVGNPLGVNLFLEKEVDPIKVEKTAQMTRDAGIKWVRQVFAWNDIEISGKGDFTDRRGTGPEVSAWAKYDRIVDVLRKYDLEIVARLDSPPVWARRPGDDVQTYHKGPPRDNKDYADFVSAVASRYKGKIRYFQIWNEPNLYGEWGGHPVSPPDYTEMLKAAYQAVKSANPDGVVITAALAPTAEQSMANLNDVLFLEGMYKAGAAPYFDILSTMLYGLGQSPQERRTDLNRLNFSRPVLLRHVMERYGDTRKPIWISEYGWISLPPDFSGDPAKNIWGKSVDEQTQARWIVEGYERIRKEWPWVGAVCIWQMRQPDPVPGEPANYFAILHDDFTPRPAYNAVKEYSKRFPVADTGTYAADSPALSPVITYEGGTGVGVVLGSPSPVDVFTETLRFSGDKLVANLCADCALSLLNTDNSSPRSLNDTDRAILDGHPPTTGVAKQVRLAGGLGPGAHTATVLAYIGPAAANDPAPLTFTVARDKPPWNASGLPVVYALFLLLAAASGGYATLGVSRWASAVVNMPRGRYSDAARETARNGAAVLGMAVLVGLYWQANSLPLVLATMAGLGLLALFKPSVGLAAVVVAIPFFWYPKQIGSQHFPLAETLLLIVFGAVMARRILATLSLFYPALATRLHLDAASSTPRGSIARVPPRSPGADGRAEHAGRREHSEHAGPPNGSAAGTAAVALTEEQIEELLPAHWPRRPVTAPLGGSRVQVARGPATTRAPALDADPKDTIPLPVSLESLESEAPPMSAAAWTPSGIKPRVRPGLPRMTVPRLDRQTMREAWHGFLEWNSAGGFAAPAVAMLLAGSLAMLTLADPAYARDSARAFKWVIVEPVLFYFLVTEVGRTRRAAWRLVDFFVAAAVGIALYGIWQYAAGDNTLAVEGVSRVSGVYQHPNNLALYLGRVLPLAAVAGIFLPWGWRKLLYLLAAVPLAITTLLTFSRGAYIAAAVAIAAALVIGLRTRAHTNRDVPLSPARRGRWVLWASSGAVILGVALVLLAALLPRVPERIFAAGSGELRVELWNSSLRMLRDHPVFGVGPDQFLNQFRAHYITPGQKEESFTAHPHNIFLDYWLTLGIMGVPILLWLLWKYFRVAAGKALSMARAVPPDQAGRAIMLGLFASMTDFLVHGLVDNSYFLMDLAMIFWLSCALVWVVGREDRREQT